MVDRIVLYRHDASVTSYGAMGGHPEDTQLLERDETIVRVTGVHGGFRGHRIVFYTSRGRRMALNGATSGSPQHAFDFAAPEGHSVVDLAWQDQPAGDARDGRVSGVVSVPDRVARVVAYTGGEVDYLRFDMQDGSIRGYGPPERAVGSGLRYNELVLDLVSRECIARVRWKPGRYRGHIELTTTQGRVLRLPEQSWPPTATGGAEGGCQQAAAPENGCIVALRWDRAQHGATHASCVGAVFGVAPQEPPHVHYGARIGATGLPDATADEFERHALGVVARVLGGNHSGILREHSQCYGTRNAENMQYMDQGYHYSPPTTGLMPDTGCEVFKVVKVGLRLPSADGCFGPDHRIAFHGTNSRTFKTWQPNQQGAIQLLPSAHGAHGPGIYLTPSFSMALLYSYMYWDEGIPRFAHSPDFQYPYCIVLMVDLPVGAYEEKKGTAFSHLTDGWDQGRIEWLVPPDKADRCTVYGVLFCYFRPEALQFPVRDKGTTLAPEAGTGIATATGWDGLEVRVPRKCSKDMPLQVRRGQTGLLEACNFCYHHARHSDGLAVAFTKAPNHVLALPTLHARSLGSRQFWSLDAGQRRELLWRLREAALREARRSREEAGSLIRSAETARRDGGVWTYDPDALSDGDVVMVFHTTVSREHLHLHALVANRDGASGNPHIVTAGDPVYSNLGRSGSYSITWRQVYELCCVEVLPSCARQGCTCTVALNRWRRMLYQSGGRGVRECDPEPEASLEFCCRQCREGQAHSNVEHV
jgi:hypothetical protein